MKPDPSPQRVQRRRRRLQTALFCLAVCLVFAGFAVLAVPPQTPMPLAIDRAFIGLGLLLAGFLAGLLARFP